MSNSSERTCYRLLLSATVAAACLGALFASGCTASVSQPSAGSTKPQPEASSPATPQPEASSPAATSATPAGDNGAATAQKARVLAVFKGWIAAMSNLGASPTPGYWSARPLRKWAEGDVRHHTTGYRVVGVEVSGDRATVDATFHVTQLETSSGEHKAVDSTEPYFVKLRRESNGEWKIIDSTSSRFLVTP